MVYLQQGLKGISVYNQILTLCFKNGKLLSKAGSFISSLDKKVNLKNGNPVILPANAVQAALADRKLIAISLACNRNNDTEKSGFGDLGVSEKHNSTLAWLLLTLNLLSDCMAGIHHSRNTPIIGDPCRMPRGKIRDGQLHVYCRMCIGQRLLSPKSAPTILY